MPLFRLSRRIAGAERISTADVFDVAAERVISQGRLVLCVLSLFAVKLDPTQPETYAETAFWLLLAYSVVAAGIAAVTLFRSLDPRARIATHCIDVAAISALLWMTDGSGSPFFSFFTFVLLAATLRWDWPAVVLTALVLALVFLLAGIVQHVATAHLPTQEFDLNRAIIRGAYLVVTGGLLAYVSAYRERTHQRLLRLARWSVRDQQNNSAVARALAHAASVLDVSRVLVLWDEGEEPDLNIALWSGGDYRQWRELSGTYEHLVPREIRGVAFISNDPNADRVQQEGGSSRVKPPLIDPRLVATFQIGPFSTAAFEGTICSGRVFMLDGKAWSDDHVLLTEVLAAGIGAELDREALQREAELSAVIRDRARFTRDLHDGLLQTLTAAGLQLKMLADTVGEEARSRIETIKTLLAGEQRRIRSVIQFSESKPTATAFRLEQDLMSLLADPSQLWNCDISVEAEPKDAVVPSALGGQLSFILAEAVANAVRHGRATKVRVRVKLDDDGLDFRVRDNGRGFDEAVLGSWKNGSAAEKHAPASIRARVSDLGGSLHIVNSAQGAELQIRLPIR